MSGADDGASEHLIVRSKRRFPSTLYFTEERTIALETHVSRYKRPLFDGKARSRREPTIPLVSSWACAAILTSHTQLLEDAFKDLFL